MKIRLTLKQVRVGALILTLMWVSGWCGWRLGRQGSSLRESLRQVVVDRSQPEDKSQIDLGMFWRVWDKLESSYLIKEDLNSQKMVWGAIRGMTAALGDPYTVFLPPEQNQATKEELNGSFEGVGIQLGFKDNHLAVIAPLAGTPAEAAGIKAGDYILSIKDEQKGIETNTAEMSLPEAVEIIRGPRGTAVVLTVLHEDDTEPAEIEIVRDTIVIKSVELESGQLAEGKWQKAEGEKCQGVICGEIAYIKLSRFGDRTEQEWNEAVQEIVNYRGELKGVVLDLRNNPGGYLQGAVQYAGEFLERGSVVVKQEDAKGRIESYSVEQSGRLLTQPLVVLVNQGSASSSEILAGALKDHGRAKLVGSKTFGKGTIQEALDVGEGAGLHVTTAKWLLPSGTWVNETEGITPDVEVELNKDKPETDEQLIKAIELLTEQS